MIEYPYIFCIRIYDIHKPTDALTDREVANVQQRENNPQRSNTRGTCSIIPKL